MSSPCCTTCIILLAIFSPSCTISATSTYEPTWESLDKRPLPTWFDTAKIGIFLHWGVFSVPSYHSEWFWWDWKGDKLPDVVRFMQRNYPPDFTYADFAEQFHAEFFDPNEWAELFQSSGAKYVVLTSKHHDGYCNWKTKYSWNWNSVDVGPKRDLVAELATAIRNKTNLRFGLYHSMYEWFNPMYLHDQSNNFSSQAFVILKSMPELYELVNQYKPEIIWSDGDWTATPSYWNSTHFLAWLYNESPVKETVVTNDRWGSGTLCQHGGYYTCSDEYSPGHLVPHKWENCLKLDRKSWGYRRDAQVADILSIEELLEQLASTVSCGGNLLINVGPSREGRIMPIYEERLRQLGSWLRVNGEAIYDTMPWLSQNDTITEKVWYTQSRDRKTVYAILLNPNNFAIKPTLELGSVKPASGMHVQLVGHETMVAFHPNPSTGGITIKMPFRVTLQWAWVLRIR